MIFWLLAPVLGAALALGLAYAVVLAVAVGVHRAGADRWREDDR